MLQVGHSGDGITHVLRSCDGFAQSSFSPATLGVSRLLSLLTVYFFLMPVPLGRAGTAILKRGPKLIRVSESYTNTVVPLHR